MKAEYRVFADLVLARQMNGPGSETPGILMRNLSAEMAEAEEWYESLVRDEEAWIEAGVDVDAAFAAKYYTDPVVGEVERSTLSFFSVFVLAITTGVSLFGVTLLVTAAVQYRSMGR